MCGGVIDFTRSLEDRGGLWVGGWGRRWVDWWVGDGCEQTFASGLREHHVDVLTLLHPKAGESLLVLRRQVFAAPDTG